MSRFPPDKSVLTSVRMTRTAYAQLQGQKFFPPKIFGQWKEKEGTKEWRWRDVGMKIVGRILHNTFVSQSHVRNRLWASRCFTKKVKAVEVPKTSPKTAYVFAPSERYKDNSSRCITRPKLQKKLYVEIQTIKRILKTLCPLVISKAKLKAPNFGNSLKIRQPLPISKFVALSAYPRFC